MKDREQYERLISDSLDRPLSQVEETKLQEAILKYPELAEFKAELIKQATLVLSLPELRTDPALRLSEEETAHRGILWSLWNLRISVPLPVAAVLVLALVGFALFGALTRPTLEAPVMTQQAKTIEYVQIERLKPATAILILQSDNKNQSHKDAL
jgi:hypothetical protein